MKEVTKMREKLMRKKAMLLGWANLPYLDAHRDCQKGEELRTEVNNLERSLAE